MKLTALEMRWAIAALGAIFPGSRDDGLADIRAMDVHGFLNKLLLELPFRAALGLRIAVWLVALAPLFVLGRPTTLAGLDPMERERVVASLICSRAYAVRSLALVLKTLGAMLYAGDGAVQARMRIPARPRPTLVALRTKRLQPALEPVGPSPTVC